MSPSIITTISTSLTPPYPPYPPWDPTTALVPPPTTSDNGHPPSPALERYYYFAYGSNLWHSQMSHRCPSSRLIGTGYLHGYRWIISARGYANVVPSHSPSPCTSANTDGTYGAIYTLSPTDLATLDLYEGVDVTPVPCYLKVTMPIRLLSAPGPEKGVDVIPCLVYVDPRTQEGVVREEYIRRINLGLRDAGLPKEWVRKVVRRWIPTEEGDESESEEEEKCDEDERGGVLEEVDDEVGWGGRKVIAKREDDGVVHWVPTGE